MKIRRKNGLKIAAITIALLLCLALAVGITGAWYQAQRQATGTLSMDQGIIIDYKGFDKTGDEWSKWERTATLPLFTTTNAQPGEQITVNAAGIRANEKSVNFYARVKLTYKFYNVSGETETEVTLANTSDLITTSPNFFGTNWVDGGSTDGYYYYATGSTLNKFEKGAAATTPFVNLFADGAYLEIAGENFVGADNNGEGGGFVVGDTSINKIEVYLTLETLQGDATAEQAKDLGWKISQNVDFSKVNSDNISVVNSETGKEFLAENVTSVKQDIDALNVTIDGNSTLLKNAIFPYDEEVTLNFDSRNVDYITLNYSTGESETFGLKAEDFANDHLSETALKVTAKSEKGIVTGYVVGWFSSKEYEKFTFSDHHREAKPDDTSAIGNMYLGTDEKLGENECSITGYWGTEKSLEINETYYLRSRDFLVEIETRGYTSMLSYLALQSTYFEFPLQIKEFNLTINNNQEFEQFLSDLDKKYPSNDSSYSEKFKEDYPTISIISQKLVITKNVLYSKYTVKTIMSCAFSGYLNMKYREEITDVTLPNSIEKIGCNAFLACYGLTAIKLDKENTKLNEIGDSAFINCDSLTTTIADLGGTWKEIDTYNGNETEITDNTRKLKSFNFYYIKRIN